MGYTVPAVKGHEQTCDYDRGVRPPGPVHLEPPDQVQILMRVEHNQVGKIRAISGDCQLDADGVPLAGSAMCSRRRAWRCWFAGQVHKRTPEHVRDGAVTAIALHADAAADEVLERFAAPGQPESARKSHLLDGRGARTAGIRNAAAHRDGDASDHIRDKAIFALSVSQEPQAVDTMIAVAHNDTSGACARAGAVLAGAEGWEEGHGGDYGCSRARPGYRSQEEGGLCAAAASERAGRSDADSGCAHQQESGGAEAGDVLAGSIRRIRAH